MRKRKIRNYVVNKNMQLRVTLQFVIPAICFSALSGLSVFFTLWPSIAKYTPEAGEIEQYFRVTTMYMLALSSLGVLCLITAFGIIITHRVAGPVYRMQNQLERLLQGENIVSIELRKGDEFKELAETINKVLEHTRKSQENSESEDSVSSEGETS